MDNQEPKFVFFVEDLTDAKNLEISLPQDYSKAFVEYKTSNYYEPISSGKVNKIHYSIGNKLNNFGT